MTIKRILLFIAFIILAFNVQFASSNTNSKLKKITTVHGSSYGFYLTKDGYFLTTYSVLSSLKEGKKVLGGNIIHSENISKSAWVKKIKPLEGYALLKGKKIKESPYTLGDSDSVDIGDKVYLPAYNMKVKSKSGKILYKLYNYNNYYYPCFIANFAYDTNDIGKPVLDINNRVIGIYISFQNNNIIIPINRIKPHIKDSLQPQTSMTEKYKATNDADKNGEKQEPMDFATLKPIKAYGSPYDYRFGLINDFSFDHQNNLYLIDNHYHELKKVSLSGLIPELTEPIIKAPEPVMETSNVKQNGDDDKKTTNNGKDDTEKTMNGVTKTETKKEDHKPEPTTIKTTIDDPTSITLTLAGIIYVLDNKNNSILIYNSNLKLIEKLDFQKIASDFDPEQIRAFGNKIFVTSKTIYGENQLYQLDYSKEEGKTIARKVSLKSVQGQYQLLDLAYEGNQFYWLDKKNLQIFVINNQWKLINTFSVANESQYPSSISVYKNQIYLFDQETKKIAIYRPNGNFIRYWTTNIAVNQGNPVMVKVSSSGILAVSYNNLPHIRLYHLNGNFIKTLSAFSEKNREVESPISLSVDKQNRLAILNGNPQIYYYPIMNNANNSIEIKYPFGKDLNLSLRGITSGNLNSNYISDTYLDQIIIYPNSKNQTDKFSGKELGELNQPVQLTSDKNYIYIVDKENHRIVIMNEQGLLQKTVQIANKKSELLYPQDVTVDNSGNIFVLAENQVLFFNKDGELKNEFMIQQGDNSILGYAKGIAFHNQHLYVSDSFNHRILIYSLTGELKHSIGQYGGNLNQLNHPSDLLFYNNQLFIADKGNHRIVSYGSENLEKEQGDNMEVSDKTMETEAKKDSSKMPMTEK